MHLSILVTSHYQFYLPKSFKNQETNNLLLDCNLKVPVSVLFQTGGTELNKIRRCTFFGCAQGLQ